MIHDCLKKCKWGDIFDPHVLAGWIYAAANGVHLPESPTLIVRGEEKSIDSLAWHLHYSLEPGYLDCPDITQLKEASQDNQTLMVYVDRLTDIDPLKEGFGLVPVIFLCLDKKPLIKKDLGLYKGIPFVWLKDIDGAPEKYLSKASFKGEALSKDRLLEAYKNFKQAKCVEPSLNARMELLTYTSVAMDAC